MRTSVRVLSLQKAQVRRYMAFEDVMKEVMLVRRVWRFMWPDVGMRRMWSSRTMRVQCSLL